jgi:hypothetical protein
MTLHYRGQVLLKSFAFIGTTVFTNQGYAQQFPSDMPHISHVTFPITETGIATGYRLHDRGVRVRVPSRVKNFLLSILSEHALEPTQPPIQWVLMQGL